MTVTLIDVDEPGSLWLRLTTLTPAVGQALTAMLRDPDLPVRDQIWGWERTESPNDPLSWLPITGATSASYLPVSDDLDFFLRVTVTYRDVHDGDTDQKSLDIETRTRVEPKSTSTTGSSSGSGGSSGGSGGSGGSDASLSRLTVTDRVDTAPDSSCPAAAPTPRQPTTKTPTTVKQSQPPRP